jgi:hypothetical protein
MLVNTQHVKEVKKECINKLSTLHVMGTSLGIELEQTSIRPGIQYERP